MPAARLEGRLPGNNRRRGDASAADPRDNLPDATNWLRWRPVSEQVLPSRSRSPIALDDPLRTLDVQRSGRDNVGHVADSYSITSSARPNRSQYHARAAWEFGSVSPANYRRQFSTEAMYATRSSTS